MWRKFSENKKRTYLRKWLGETIKDETRLSITRHIVKHAKEIFKKEPREWSASMRNLISAYEIFCDIEKPSSDLRLEKLENKYKKNNKRYTAPPRI